MKEREAETERGEIGEGQVAAGCMCVCVSRVSFRTTMRQTRRICVANRAI